MSDLLYEIQDGIATITLNRPDQLNAFSPEMIRLWEEALVDARRNDAVQVVVVTGAGRAFCAGGDVKGFVAEGEKTVFDGKTLLWEQVHRVALALEDLDKPVLCALNGTAVGAGLDMALMCDLRFAAAGARLSEGYVKVGLMPGDGGTFFLPRLVGLARALELMWTGDFVTAEEACQIGLVNRVYPPEQLLPEVYAFAARLAAGPSLAIRLIKRATYQGLRMELRAHLDMVSSHMGLLFRSEDHAEGARAIVEKRPPHFRGR